MIKKILVPLDGSELAEKALPYAANLAQLYQAELILVRSLQPAVVVSEIKMAFHGPRVFVEKDEANVYLTGVQRKLGKLNLPARIAVLEGHRVSEAITDVASKEAVDAIVMSTHGRSRFGRWLAASVTEEVLQHAPCPVFLVRVAPVKY
jgi:nucleotide-binding universal stress UspA family protein